MHRFMWDVHYQPLPGGGGGRGGLPIAAIPFNTAPAPATPWVPPGQYTVKLTVNGKTLSQPLTVTQDPRVKTPALAMQQVYTLSTAAYREAANAFAAAAQAACARWSRRSRRARDDLATALTASEEIEESPEPGGGGGRGGRGGAAPGATPASTPPRRCRCGRRAPRR
jgi:hypothetical protein